nr:hypothetical protein [uncultured Eisenbergiella sp.]
MVEMILGDTDIDSVWDNYLAELNAVGVNRMLEIYQEVLDARQ